MAFFRQEEHEGHEEDREKFLDRINKINRIMGKDFDGGT